MTLRISIFLLSSILFFCGFIVKVSNRKVHFIDYHCFANLKNNDTLIVYDIYGVSTEGAEAKVLYSNKNIKKAIIRVFGETGQYKIVYSFYGTRINVEETAYSYREDFTKVKSSNDITLEKIQNYSIDYNGNIIGPKIEEYIDVFKEFRAVVPFKLR